MKISKKDIEITGDQLFELFRADPEGYNILITHADCLICKSKDALIDYRILLTTLDTIQIDGKCGFCNQEMHEYSGMITNKWFKAAALIIQIESQGMSVRQYRELLDQEEKTRQLRKTQLKFRAMENPVYFQIHISLLDIHPKIWRRILILPTTSLKTLHKILQIAMGWTDSHLHQFEYEGEYYGVPWDEDPEFINDYQRMRINDFLLYPKESCIYEYDYGDSWNHLIQLEEVLFDHERLAAPVCLDGARKCPPEDCGGTDGYTGIKKIIKNSKHSKYQDIMRWLGGSFNPDEFDIDQINSELLRRSKFRYPQV
ncbi:MAG: plasmid pRiA4b ORF-3 family protein [Bacteroidales bacterium]